MIGSTITIDIYKSNTLFGIGILDWIVPDNKVSTLTQTIGSDGKAVITWNVPDVDSKTYYYAYSHVDPYSSEPTLHLETSPTISNTPPSAIISYPNYNSVSNYKFPLNSQITFTQLSYDVDDGISTYAWDFDSGNPSTSTSPTPSAVTYSTPGPNYISLTVTDERGASSADTVGILIDEASTNQAPLVVITSPESGQTYSQSVLVDATKTIDDNTPFEQLSFTWYFDGIADVDHTNVLGTAGALFNKVFDTSGPHSITVIVED